MHLPHSEFCPATNRQLARENYATKLIAVPILVAALAGCSTNTAVPTGVNAGVYVHEYHKVRRQAAEVNSAAMRAYDQILADELERIESVKLECIEAAEAGCVEAAETRRAYVIEQTATAKASIPKP